MTPDYKAMTPAQIAYEVYECATSIGPTSKRWITPMIEAQRAAGRAEGLREALEVMQKHFLHCECREHDAVDIRPAIKDVEELLKGPQDA